MEKGIRQTERNGSRFGKRLWGRSRERLLLGSLLASSLLLKIVVILRYANRLTLSSDDLGYYKSAVVLIRKGILTYHGFNDPTVFITPLYPLFLAGVFKAAGTGFTGIQTARLLQAVLATLVVLMVFLIARRVCDAKTGLWAAFLTTFYFPNTVTAGYLLTETLFTFLLCLLIVLSLSYAASPSVPCFMLLGCIWALSSLCRPTIALFPLLFALWVFFTRKGAFRAKLKAMRGFVLPAVAMAAVFVLVMAPWWVRNYIEYASFIPLSASSGNPTLQGTYIGYQPEEGGYQVYRLGKNTYEDNAVETKVAWERIRKGFKTRFFQYLKWYTLGKTAYLWKTPFYWKAFLHVGAPAVFAFHYLALAAAICGAALLASAGGISRASLLILVILYFNIVHCITMAFDRYAFPLMPLVFVFSAYFFARLAERLKSSFSGIRI